MSAKSCSISTSPSHYDLCIVGGGLAGAGLAACLGGSPLRVALFERVPFEAGSQPGYDDRGLALSPASCRILNAGGVWPRLEGMTSPIRRIHVSDRKNFGFVRFSAAELGLDALARVVVARDLGRVLLEHIAGLPNVDYFSPAAVDAVQAGRDRVTLEFEAGTAGGGVSCALLVAADGARSPLRRQAGIEARTHDYGQTSIVANLTPSRHHDCTAYERFTPHGPLALLPMRDRRCVSIFTVPGKRAGEYLDLDEDAYLEVLGRFFGRRLGRLEQLGTRKAYPLVSVRAREQYRGRVLLLGNAAHTLHPNGAQGFNLALRDAAALAETLIRGARSGRDPGEEDLLERYSRARRDDQARVIGFTEGLGHLFYSEAFLKRCCRGLGMQLLDASPALKQVFSRMAMGEYGRQPGYARGLGPGQI